MSHQPNERDGQMSTGIMLLLGIVIVTGIFLLTLRLRGSEASETLEKVEEAQPYSVIPPKYTLMNDDEMDETAVTLPYTKKKNSLHG